MRRTTLFRRITIGMLAGLAIGAVISEATYFFLRGGESRSPQIVLLRIPAGTAEKVSKGEPEPSLPTSMSFVVGDKLVVQNDDSSAHQLGPLFIPPGTSASLELNSTQNSAAECSFQPGRYLGIEVQPPLTWQTRALGILQAGVPLGFLLILYGVFALPFGKAAEA